MKRRTLFIGGWTGLLALSDSNPASAQLFGNRSLTVGSGTVGNRSKTVGPGGVGGNHSLMAGDELTTEAPASQAPRRRATTASQTSGRNPDSSNASSGRSSRQ